MKIINKHKTRKSYEKFRATFSRSVSSRTEKNKHKEWGKLGGRPRIENRKTEKITLRFTPSEMNLLESKSKEKNLKITEYCRVILNEKKLPNVEQNKILIEYANNFSRLSNFIKSSHFEEHEKKEFLSVLQTLVTDIREKIQWL